MTLEHPDDYHHDVPGWPGSRRYAVQHHYTPTLAEAREHVAAGGVVEQFWHSDQRWHRDLAGATRRTLEGPSTSALRRHRPALDTPQYGLRLVVEVAELLPVGRALIGRRWQAENLAESATITAFTVTTTGDVVLDLARADGHDVGQVNLGPVDTVEVLR